MLVIPSPIAIFGMEIALFTCTLLKRVGRKILIMFYKRKSIYRNLQRKIMLIILCVSIIPLVSLGETIYYRFARTYGEKIEDQIKYRARSQSDAKFF